MNRGNFIRFSDNVHLSEKRIKNTTKWYFPIRNFLIVLKLQLIKVNENKYTYQYKTLTT